MHAITHLINMTQKKKPFNSFFYCLCRVNRDMEPPSSGLRTPDRQVLPSNVNQAIENLILHIEENLKIKNRIIRSIQIVDKNTFILYIELYQLYTEFGHLDINTRSLIMKE